MGVVAVVGGGIAGLAAAHRLIGANPDLQVIVLEASPQVGGKLRRVRVGGAWVDVGAEAMLARRPEGIGLARSAGLGAELIYPLTTSALLRNRGHNVALPGRTLLGIPAEPDWLTDVLEVASRQLIDTEPARGPYPPLASDISVGALVRQRFGDEVVDRLLDPLLGGVYAGRADDISLEMAIPALAARLRSDGGSLLDATRALVGPALLDPAPAGPAVANAPVFASVAGGLARLPETLAADPRLSVRTSCTVRSVQRAGASFELHLGSAANGPHRGNPGLLVADAVIVAAPAGKAGAMLTDMVPAAVPELASIRAASVAIVSLAFGARHAFRSAEGFTDSGMLPAGSGLLIPALEGMAVKAMTFSSQKWPGVGAESGVMLLRGSFGRAGDQRDLQRSDSDLIALLRRALADTVALSAEPVAAHVQRWGGGLPQYPPGHQQRVQRIRSAIDAVPGLAVCGASYDGVGIPACIASANNATARVLAHLGG
jgi:oxygen-dependent protoporphyrinogen oxidase